MKIYARQVPPEYQESPLFLDDDFLFENANIFGNKGYKQHVGKLFGALPHILENLCDAWETITSGAPGYYDSWIDALADIAQPEGRSEYTREERKNAWPELLERYCNTYDDPEVYTNALTLVTGRAWDWCTLRGDCQGDWQYCVYRVDEWDKNALERLETAYFNTGSEWIVHNGNEAPEDPKEIDGFSVYCYGWNKEQIKEEIADAYGAPGADVVLYEIAGQYTTYKWREAQ